MEACLFGSFHQYSSNFFCPLPPILPSSPAHLVPIIFIFSLSPMADIDPEREQALEEYKRSLLDLREWEAKLKSLRMGIKDLQREFDVSEENIKALQSVGQIIGEVLKQLDEERCTFVSCSPL